MINPLNELESYRNLREALKAGKTPLLATGAVDSQKSHLIYALISDTKRSALIVTQSELHARQIYEDMRFFLKNMVKLYPARDIAYYSADAHSADITSERLSIINGLVGNDEVSIVLSVEALADWLLPKSEYIARAIYIRISDEINRRGFLEKLVGMGFERTELVEGVGQFAMRGGIVDVYSINYDYPARIEFWDDNVYSIRLIDPVTQRSVENLDELRITPVREFPPNYTGEPATLLNYLPDNTLLFFDEPQRIAAKMNAVLDEYGEIISLRASSRKQAESSSSHDKRGKAFIAAPNGLFPYARILADTYCFKTVLLTTLAQSVKDFNLSGIFGFQVKSQTSTLQLDQLTDELKYYIRNDYRVVILAGTRLKAKNIASELDGMGIASRYIDDINSPSNAELPKRTINVTSGSLDKGFEYQHINFAVISDKELFGGQRRERKKPRKAKNKKATRIDSFTDLNVGDFVVHESHGVGVYKGIEQMFVDGIVKDYLKLQYADGGALYVHTSQLDMVQKYIGGEGARVKLNNLSNDSWSKAKAKAKKAVAELAQDLVDLYAKRNNLRGHVYSTDSVWQREFEDSFPFEETDDQISAIEDVKRDMESPKLMDRLICGDVGYGKTEIALRAAFKAVQESKQVAFLVPTTILTQQHYNTLAQRLKDFPISVEVLSRFRTTKQQKETIARVQCGLTDIVIGTHRLLSDDIKFKDLGLIIIDEEQRFGVAHKEKLKKMRENVDVLTLTATPIPRTLHMSLTGIRDLSLLEEPPQERKPVQTYVMEYSQELVRDAILRELARDGQVYYLHNRVMSIQETAVRVQKLVPEASIAYAHGQMSERELENIMLDFIEGDINVLVCTTIIESGLDISNVNTIIIEDSDHMGLSQLYQLRGRVGRSNRLAYAYLCYRKDKILEENAEKRLQTIREFTEFGSGMKIAMRDLEIRGAGNLLGMSQHGHMDAVGYEMYCKLLNEAFRQLKGEIVEAGFETLIDINIDAYIPVDYIGDEEQKLEIYKKIAGITSEADYFDVQDEIEDRYGNIPSCVQNLLDIATLKAYAHNLGIISLQQRSGNIVMQFKPDANVDLDRLAAVVNRSKNLRLSVRGNPVMSYPFTGDDLPKKLRELRELLKDMCG